MENSGAIFEDSEMNTILGFILDVYGKINDIQLLTRQESRHSRL